jgi:hypothetical protein
MNESQTVQLSQSSEYLKQYVLQLTGLAVLLEVPSEIHLVPLEDKKCSFIRELNSDQLNNIFALFNSSLVQNLVFKVELLCQHEVLFESLISVSPNEVVAMSFTANVPNKIDL